MSSHQSTLWGSLRPELCGRAGFPSVPYWSRFLKWTPVAVEVEGALTTCPGKPGPSAPVCSPSHRSCAAQVHQPPDGRSSRTWASPTSSCSSTGARSQEAARPLCLLREAKCTSQLAWVAPRSPSLHPVPATLVHRLVTTVVTAILGAGDPLVTSC